MPFDLIESACRQGKSRKGIPVRSAADVHRLGRQARRQLGL